MLLRSDSEASLAASLGLLGDARLRVADMRDGVLAFASEEGATRCALLTCCAPHICMFTRTCERTQLRAGACGGRTGRGRGASEHAGALCDDRTGSGRRGLVPISCVRAAPETGGAGHAAAYQRLVRSALVLGKLYLAPPDVDERCGDGCLLRVGTGCMPSCVRRV